LFGGRIFWGAVAWGIQISESYGPGGRPPLASARITDDVMLSDKPHTARGASVRGQRFDVAAFKPGNAITGLL
jgi:hypothetical protein